MRPRLLDIFMCAILVLFIFAAAMTIQGCSTLKEGFGGTYAHRPLAEQIIRMRPGHKGLTHQICAEKNWLGECLRMDLIEYDLNNKEVRASLVNLQFRCSIGGSRYKIHPDKPLFVRYKRVKDCWLCKERTIIEKFVELTKTQFLIDAATVCWSEKTYPDGLMEGT